MNYVNTMSIVIPTYNKHHRLEIMLKSLLRLDLSQSTEVIIIDDGSTDDTNVLLRNFIEHLPLDTNMNIIPLHIENSGRSVARNTGIIQAKGTVILFLDDDVILDPHLISRHLDYHNQYEDAVVHGRIFSLPYLKFFPDPCVAVLENGTHATGNLADKVIRDSMFVDGSIERYLQINRKTSRFEQDIQDLFKLYEQGTFSNRWIGFTGANVSVSRRNLLKAGLYDINMGREWGCEDLELGYRLCQTGLKFFYAFEAANYHMNHFRENALDIHAQSLCYFYEKHRDKQIALLGDYFSKGLSSLIFWDNAMNRKQEYCLP